VAGFGRLAAVEADRRQGASEAENYGRGPWQEGLRNSTLYITLVALQCKCILVAKAATRGLTAAMALKRLRMVSPSTARQLFGATVAPVVDYASNIWMHACGVSAIATINRVQRIGAQAITGTFRTVATAIGEAEASIRSVRERHSERATKLWVDLRTLCKTNPLSRLRTKMLQRFTSPLQKIAYTHRDTPTDKMEVI
jgi:hypothetical protein